MTFLVFDERTDDGSPAVDDPALRKALGLAIDRDKLVERALGGLGQPGTFGLLPPFYGAASSDLSRDRQLPLAYDRARARAVLDRAGWHTGRDGVRMRDGVRASLVLSVQADRPSDLRTAVLLEQMARHVGIEIRLNLLGPAVLSRGRDMPDDNVAQADASLVTVRGEPTPDSLLAAFASGSSDALNAAHWGDASYDALLAQQSSEPRRARIATLRNMQRLVVAGAPVVALYSPDRLTAVSTARWDGWSRSPEQDGLPLSPYSYEGVLALRARPDDPRYAGPPLLLLSLAVRRGRRRLALVPLAAQADRAAARGQRGPSRMRRAGVARAVVDAAALAGAAAGLALIAGALARTPDRAVDAVGAVADAAPYTALLLGTALCVSFPLACWLGTATGMRSGSGAGRWLRALAIGLTAAPVAWTAMLLVLVLTRGPGLFPPGLAADPGPAPAGQTVVWVTYEHLALPLIALASALTGALALLIAGGVERAMAGGPYKAALTAGMARRDALARVALPAALAPLLPLAGVATAVAISAAIVVEAVFQWPGLGRLALRAAGARDLETLQALFLGTAAVSILAGLAGDLAALRYAAGPTARRVHRVARRPALAGAVLLAAALGAGIAVALVSDAHRSPLGRVPAAAVVRALARHRRARRRRARAGPRGRAGVARHGARRRARGGRVRLAGRAHLAARVRARRAPPGGAARADAGGGAARPRAWSSRSGRRCCSPRCSACSWAQPCSRAAPASGERARWSGSGPRAPRSRWRPRRRSPCWDSTIRAARPGARCSRTRSRPAPRDRAPGGTSDRRAWRS